MGSYSRKLQRTEEKKKLEELKSTYGKKPKNKCPKCGYKSLFITNNEGKVYCIRCDEIVMLKK